MAKPNAAFMSSVPELVVLRLLSDREMYGYELVKAIRLASNERLTPAEGVIYPLLHSLEQRGHLKSVKRQVLGRNRIYYRTTSTGKKQLQGLTAEWRRITKALTSIIGESV